MKVDGLNPAASNLVAQEAQKQRQNKEGFGDALMGAVRSVNQEQQKANQSVDELATGKRKTLHETMIQMEKSEISFRLLMAVRGKLVNAYQEVMRMHF